MDHIVYSLDASSGSIIWQTEDLGGAIVGQPAIDESGNILVGTFANELVSINDRGNINWRFPTDDWVWTRPVISGEQVVIADISGTVYSVNIENGVGEWQAQPGGPIIGDPWVTEDGSVVIGTEDGELFMLNDNGTIQWTQTTEYTFYSGPLQTDDIFLITSNQPDAILIAYNENGAPRWVFSPEN
jgi:outer membrane protein assembly factor BamB